MIWFGQPSHKISFQKKKGKKRKPSFHVEGFKKASFSDEILPLISEQYSVAVFSGSVQMNYVYDTFGVEILSETEGLNLLF